ncbi:MAG: amino acid adenylation domain-containing protein [Cyclobacteriaceae bacterium]
MAVAPDDLCYLIYTSGTTGKPKGVMIEHRSAADLTFTVNKRLKEDHMGRFLQYASIVFDASVFEIFSCLLHGNTLYLASAKEREDGKLLEEFIKNHEIDTALLPPVLLPTLDTEALTSVKNLFVGGEACSPELVKKWQVNRQLINAYGPTEITVCATMHTYETQDLSTNIGKPLPNTQIYVLDQYLQPVPIGIVGEMYVGGTGVARGYHNRKELTDERFILIPFNSSEKLYKTGDLGRWSEDGNLEYIGRNDEQVKLRGYRIELGEVEAALATIEGIAQSCVMLIDRAGHKYLAGYYVSDQTFNPESLHTKLLTKLPEYMIPSVFVAMSSFPVTISGKIDRKSLPDPELNNVSGYVAPQNSLEAELCHIWALVLNLEQVGATDHFFRIGGDSIISIQLSGRIRELGYSCQVKDVFNHPTVRQLAKHISANSETNTIITEQGRLSGSFDFLPVQQWFFDQVAAGLFAEPSHWNQSFLIRVPALSIDKLEQALTDLVKYHDVFRLRFDEGKQTYQEETDCIEVVRLDVNGLSEQAVKRQLTEWQAGFSLSEGSPLYKFGYLSGYKDNSARVFMALHHLIVDAVSWRILAADLQRLYTGDKLPAKGSSYRQWVEKIQNYPEVFKEERSFWPAQLEGSSVLEKIPVKKEPSLHEVTFSSKLTKALLNECPKAYYTEVNDLLVTAMFMALQKLTGKKTVGITMEGHGREQMFEEIDHSRTLGWFTSMYPINYSPTGELNHDIVGIKEYLRNIPNKGVGFGAFAISAESHFGYGSMPPIGFNYLGQFDGAAALDWQVVAEESGQSMSESNHDHNLLNLNGWTVRLSGAESELRFTVASKLRTDETNRILDAFRESLTEVVHHCQLKYATSGSWHTPSDFPYVDISASLLDRLQENALTAGNQISEIFPANSLQQSFVYHSVSQPEDDAYRVQVLYDYHIALDVMAYLEAWNACIEEYPILRTAFNWEEDFMQVIYHSGKISHEFHDISHISSQEDRDMAINDIQQIDRRRGFDLSQPTLIRLHVIRQSEKLFTIIESKHHSIVDGWSGPVLQSRLHDHYQSIVKNNRTTLSIDTAYMEAQKYILLHKAATTQYWDQKVSEVQEANDINALLSIPIASDPHRVFDNQQYQVLKIEGDLYDRLKALVTREGITVNTIVQFVWHKLLQVYSGKLQSIVGTTVSGRGIPVSGIESSVGMYINTLPLIVDWDNNNSILSQLHQIHKGLTDMNSHSFADITRLQNGENRLFHSFLVFENYPVAEKSGEEIEVITRSAVEKANFPLSIIAFEYDGMLQMAFQYDSDHLTDQKACAHIESMRFLFDKLIASPETQQNTLCLLRDDNYQRLVEDQYTVGITPTPDCTIHTAFELQAEKYPQQIALVAGEVTMTYQELNNRSNQLAYFIREKYLQKTGKDLTSDTLIPLCLNRNAEMIIGILGVLKSGGAYVPIDPGYPANRVSHIIQDTDAVFVLSEREVISQNDKLLPEKKIVCIDLDEQFYSTKDVLNPGLGSKNDLAYVIYTSGTTGKPKGVMIEHHGVVNLITGLLESYDIESGENFALFANYVFDASVEQMFLSLLSGGGLYLLSKDDIADPSAFAGFMQTHAITHLDATPSYLSAVDPKQLSSLKRLTFGGEYLSESLYDRFKAVIPRVVNTYGPTEATVTALIAIDSHQLNNLPIRNIKAYVLDHFGQPVPVGVAGELYIGGAGVARGYLNRENLTAERFPVNPFATSADLKKGYTNMYGTGDLVRLLEDGSMEYIGRNDDQVKIRGYRIEPGEIEKAIASVAGVTKSCVVVKNQSHTAHLVGYYTTAAEHRLTANSLRTALSKILPDYMVPTALIPITSFPLTVNGKLDKRALPDPEFQSSTDYVAPDGETEKSISEIWTGLLGTERIGVTDHFFEIGGNSILAIQLVVRINRVFNSQIHVRSVFKHPTIRELASLLTEKGKNEVETGLIRMSKEDGNGDSNLFLVPGAGGYISIFYDLSKILEGSHIVYGFQSYGLDPAAENVQCIEDIAAANIKAMQQIDPIGPYHLGGYSFGANVIYEMSVQLQQKGFSVEKLYVIDGMPYLKELVAGKADPDFREYLQEAISAIYGYQLNEIPESSPKLTEAQQLKAVFDMVNKWNDQSLSEKDFERQITTYVHQMQLARNYKPVHEEKLTGQVILFRCAHHTDYVTDDYSWQEVSEEKVTIHPVNGDHLTILNYTNIAAIGEKIRYSEKLPAD